MSLTPLSSLLSLVLLLPPACTKDSRPLDSRNPSESPTTESSPFGNDTGPDPRDQDGDGWVAEDYGGPDCDDTDPTIHPFAEEIVDGIDQDCDGLIDDGTEAFDGDGDGWPIATDCDDSDPYTWPGATENPCDSTDQDCNGELGVCTRADVAFARFVPGALNSVFGTVAGGGDLSGDGVPDVVTALNGLTHLFEAPESAGEFTGSDAFTRLDVTGVFGAAGALVIASPLSGAGPSELVMSRTQESRDGIVLRFCEPLLGDLVAEDVACTIYRDGDSSSSFGWAIDGGSDVTGEGVADLLIGAPYAANAAGAVYLVSADGRGEVDATMGAAQIWGEVQGDQVGYSVAMSGDNNSDGIDDILVAALGADGVSGMVGWFMGPFAGTMSFHDADVLYTADRGPLSGYSLAGGADFDGDGREDFALRSWEEGIGGIHIYTEFGSNSIDGATAHLLGVERFDNVTAVGDYLGYSLALPDANGDGLADVLAGAPYSMMGGYGWSEQFGWVEPSGAAALFLAPFSGTRTMLEADGLWFGEHEDDFFGSSVSSAGDINGDGFDELLVGAGLYGDERSGSQGAVYLFLGQDSW